MIYRALRVLGLGCLVCLSAVSIHAAPSLGRISGLVLDPTGTPQMGATVLITPEKILFGAPRKLLTNDNGRFSADSVPAGAYSVKVTLSGFMPAIEEHVQVDDRHTTLLEIILGSVFSSFEKLRRQPDQQSAADDWTWVLRSSPNNRSVLQWQDVPLSSISASNSLTDSSTDESRGRVEFTSGNDPVSFANSADLPATAFAYDVGVGASSHLLVAGQVSYGSSMPTGALAAEWLPSGKQGIGPATTIVIRENSLGPNSPVFRGLRISHDDQLALTDRVSIRYGAEYIFAGLAGTTSTLRPRMQTAVQVSRTWRLLAGVAALPWQDEGASPGALGATLETLDAFPTLMMRHGRTVLANDFHEEFAVEHALTTTSSLDAAFFHDDSSHTAVIGKGVGPAPDFLEGYLSQAFAYDGGASNSMGFRVAYKQRVGRDVSTTFVYTYAGALAPGFSSATSKLRDELVSQNRHSLAGRITTAVPRIGTKFDVDYKWLDGPVVSQQDAFGQAAYDISPYLTMELHQPLPRFFAGHMEIAAAAGNLLAQGYTAINTNHGNVVLVPAYRYFRGGVSLQF